MNIVQIMELSLKTTVRQLKVYKEGTCLRLGIEFNGPENYVLEHPRFEGTAKVFLESYPNALEDRDIFFGGEKVGVAAEVYQDPVGFTVLVQLLGVKLDELKKISKSVSEEYKILPWKGN